MHITGSVLLIASVGVYSVMSYLVAQRTHELGVRIALGASGQNIVGIVVRRSVGMATLGIVIGLALEAGRLSNRCCSTHRRATPRCSAA
jgi:ABC-type antimicrobial peptide transport system permease subunit